MPVGGLNSERNVSDMEKVKLFPIKMYLAVQALREREEGQAMVEYALILALVSVAAVGVLNALGTKVTNVFNTINAEL
jgi:pilus assembly protein Flp/PilA